MRAYAELLVRTCHRRGAHAIGGTAAFIPSRKDPEVNRVALAKVREDKEREAQISRSQVWQWVRTGHFTVEQVRVEAALIEAGDEAKDLFLGLALAEELEDFLTLPAYTRLE